jgi:hypothetical protein
LSSLDFASSGHTGFLASDGSVALGGAWDMGNYALTNVNIDTGDINTAVTNTEWDAAYNHSVVVSGNPHSVTKSDVGLGNVENTALSTWAGSTALTTLGTIATGTWNGTTIAIANGGTGQTTAQAAIDALTQVSSATNEHVLTKDTATGNATWKEAAGASGDEFVDRGDPSDWDWTLTDFTTDATWRDLDLSSIVPAGAANKLVKFRLSLVDGSTDVAFQMRKKGNSNAYNTGIRNILTANISNYYDIECVCDSNRVVQYWGTSTTFSTINVVVRGWFASAGSSDGKVKVDTGATADYVGAANNDGVLRTGDGLTYTDGGDYVTLAVSGTFVDRGDPSAWDYGVGNFTTDATWRDLDLSSIVPSGAKAVLMHLSLNDGAVGSEMRFRKNGNSNTFAMSRIFTQIADVSVDQDLIVACDSNRVIEYYGSNLTFTAINLAIKGWWI